uniref:mucin-5AC-like n=1 Tax=Pristiophorus japonicus TaxID=55135 RepID=UPI00398E5E8A
SETATTREQSTQESTDRSSTIPAGSSASDPETSPTQGPEEQSTREPTDHPSTIPAGSAASGPGKGASHGTKGPSKADTECKPSKGKRITPGVLRLTDEQCEKVRADVQVMYVGTNKLDTPEKQAAYLRQVQDMLRDHLPCKKLPLKVNGVKVAKRRRKKRKSPKGSKIVSGGV